MPQIDQLLDYTRKAKASDLHLSVSSAPTIRLNGALLPISETRLTAQDTLQLVGEILTEEQKTYFSQFNNLDFSYEGEKTGRFRVNLLRQLRGMDACFRAIPEHLPTITELGLPDVVLELLNLNKGLVLVTGSSGCGKSTTLAAMISMINEQRAEHIITLEEPVEFIYPTKKALVTQRTVGVHTISFAKALRAALREDPDVILVGEMRDLETIQLAITAAETGHLVFATLNTASAHKTVDRLVGSFPADQQNHIRIMLANALRGIISQQLLPLVNQPTRVAAFEILLASQAVRNLIRENRSHQIPSIIQMSAESGMMLMDQSLMNLVEMGHVDPITAFYRAQNPQNFARFLPPDFLQEVGQFNLQNDLQTKESQRTAMNRSSLKK